MCIPPTSDLCRKRGECHSPLLLHPHKQKSPGECFFLATGLSSGRCWALREMIPFPKKQSCGSPPASLMEICLCSHQNRPGCFCRPAPFWSMRGINHQIFWTLSIPKLKYPQEQQPTFVAHTFRLHHRWSRQRLQYCSNLAEMCNYDGLEGRCSQLALYSTGRWWGCCQNPVCTWQNWKPSNISDLR